MKAVTVIGVGAMGRAIARRLAAEGYRVTAWNRAADRTAKMTRYGVAAAVSPAEAIPDAEIVLITLTDHTAMYAVLTPAAATLTGRTVVDLGAGTPDAARAAARGVHAHGGRYLAGGVRVPPDGIGEPDAVTFYSGAVEVFDSLRDTLQTLTGVDYRGADPGAALVYFQLEEIMLWSAMFGYLHAVALAAANGITAESLVPQAIRTLPSVQQLLAFYAPRIDEHDYTGDVDRLATAQVNIDNITRAIQQAGLDPTLPTAMQHLVAHAIAEG